MAGECLDGVIYWTFQEALHSGATPLCYGCREDQRDQVQDVKSGWF